ncbi:MAG TPA: hypothetical protein VNT60_05475, partial [Deinococcales bacterium]|nr:hypothetical protein [Deinococcales bacterium]
GSPSRAMKETVSKPFSAAQARATAVARAWAAENGFETVSFIAREGEPLRFHVRIGEEAPLNAWVDGVLFAQGKTDELETVLDFARGEHRRRMAGYDHYDR